MRAKKIVKIATAAVVALCLALGAMAWSVRDSNMVDRVWKQHGGPVISGGVMGFGEDSSCMYDYPYIREDGEVIGIALFQCNGYLLVFSTEHNRITEFSCIVTLNG